MKCCNDVIPFDRDDAVAHGDVRSDLEKKGVDIGGNDLLIASHALSKGLTLVTSNVREFSRVRGLKIENWAADKNIG